MVDIETDIYELVSDAVLALYSDAFTSSVYTTAPAQFPACSVMQVSNLTDTFTLDSSATENASKVVFRVDSYSNLRTGARSQAKKIAQAADEVMLSHGFKRTYYTQDYNPADSTVYTISARYSAIVTKDNEVAQER